MKSRRAAFGAVLVLAMLLLSVKSVHAVTVTPRLELNGDPGQSLRETFKVTNEQRQSQTFYLSFANFRSVDESGTPVFSDRAEDLATWIEAPSQVTIGPLDSVEVPVTVRIPSDAEPGGHFAAIFLQTSPPAPDQPGQIGISGKLGTLILLRVGGDFVQGATILEFGTKNKSYFFISLPITFYYRFQNIGDDHTKPLGDVIITNMVGQTSKILPANPVDGSVLPKSVRRFETTWSDSGKPLKQEIVAKIQEPPRGFWPMVKYEWQNFAFGKYQAKLKLAFGTKELQSANASFTFYVIPWQLLSIVIPALIITLILIRWFVRRYNRYIIGRAAGASARQNREK